MKEATTSLTRAARSWTSTAAGKTSIRAAYSNTALDSHARPRSAVPLDRVLTTLVRGALRHQEATGLKLDGAVGLWDQAKAIAPPQVA